MDTVGAGVVIWRVSHRADPRAVEIADRHYNRQKPWTAQFVPPGRCLVLLAVSGVALWVTSWPYAEWVRHRWPGAMVCSLFRRESGPPASTMIREALACTRWRWPDLPEIGLLTFINRSQVKPTIVRGRKVYGWTWMRTGFRSDGETAGGLMALCIPASDFPPAMTPAGQERLLWDCEQ